MGFRYRKSINLGGGCHEATVTVPLIGDLAVEMGYLTVAQVDELLSAQKTGCLILGQAIVDMGCLTNAELETVLNEYKTANNLTDDDFTADDNKKTERVISSFYGIEGEYKGYCSEYINILFKNLIRFIGDDFTPLGVAELNSSDTSLIREISGDFSAVTAITVSDEAAVEFASRFSKEQITENDEYTMDIISEFLNQSNGLYTVNISNGMGKELGLKPQRYAAAKEIAELGSKFTLTIPVEFSFGTVIFTIAVL